MEFATREANALRDLMVGGASSHGDLESEGGLTQAIERAGLAPFRARLEGMEAHANLWSVRPDAATADAARHIASSFELASQVLGAK